MTKTDQSRICVLVANDRLSYRMGQHNREKICQYVKNVLDGKI